MNTPVPFELAKLLKEKNFSEKVDRYYILPNEKVYNFKLAKIKEFKLECEKGLYEPYNFNKHQNFSIVSAPTITDVVMWLYEKYKIWVWVDTSPNKKWLWTINLIDKGKYLQNDDLAIEQNYYNSPNEAYQAAIFYTLNNFI